jgi:hypothetical protein
MYYYVFLPREPKNEEYDEEQNEYGDNTERCEPKLDFFNDGLISEKRITFRLSWVAGWAG